MTTSMSSTSRTDAPATSIQAEGSPLMPSTVIDGHPKRKANWKKGPPSCGECVRLKLKCTRSWPCTNCVRRGCSQLCPAGMLKPNENLSLQKTVKVLMAENERLKMALSKGPDTQVTAEVSQYSAQLQEEFLVELQNPVPMTTSTRPSYVQTPMLSRQSHQNGAKMPTTSGREDQIASATGSGAGVLDLDEETGRFIGRGAGALYVCEETEEEFFERSHSNASDPHQDLIFPFMSSDRSVLSQLHTMLPSREVAINLLQTYYTNVEWMYSPTDRQALHLAVETIYAAKDLYSGVHRIAPHRLASLLMTFALAIAFSSNIGSESALYFSAASSLLTIPKSHFMMRHSLASIECLHMMVTYLFTTGQTDAAKAAWPLLGTCVRLACGMGLHKDSGTWGLNGRDRHERERLWWECLTYDMLQSLNFGRPYSIPMHLADCPPPSFGLDSRSPLNDAFARSSDDNEFHSLKYTLTVQFSKVADVLAAPDLPSYDVVMKLDGELRAIEAAAPTWLRWREYDVITENLDPVSRARKASQQHQAALLIHKALLALHRPWYSKAMSNGGEPLLSPFAASFTACVSSARRHTQIMTSILRHVPEAAYKWWFFLFHAYTAAVIQAAVLLRAPGCMLATDIRNDFEVSFSTISDMAPNSRVARRALPTLQKLKEKLNTHGAQTGSLGMGARNASGPGPLGTPNIAGCTTSLGFTLASGPELVWEAGAGTSEDFDFSTWNQSQNPAQSESLVDPATILLAQELPAEYCDPMEWAGMDPLFQTLLHWNPNPDQFWARQE